MCSKSICEHCANQLIAFQSFADMVIISDQKLREPTFDPTIQNDKLMVEPNVTYEIRNKQHTVFLNMPVENNGLAEETYDMYENIYDQDNYGGDDTAEIKPDLATGCEAIEEVNNLGRPKRRVTFLNKTYGNGDEAVNEDSINTCEDTKSNAGDAEFQCPTCGATFQKSRYLHKHQYRSHSGITFQCELCPKVFANRENRSKHKNKMHPTWRSILPPTIKQYTCRQIDCHKKFDTLSLLALHHRAEHGLGTKSVRAGAAHAHMCKEENCNQGFPSLKKLKIHRRITGHRQFKCTSCKAIFATSEEYATHREQHVHNQRADKFQCVECLRVYDELSILLQHCSKSQHSVSDKYECAQCTICRKYYQDTDALKRHMRRKHMKHENFKDFELLQDQVYICKWCNKQFEHYETYLAHRRDHIESQSNEDSHNEYYCVECTKAYSDFEQLRRHCNVFQHELNKIYKQPSLGCTLCTSHYQSHTSLRRHMKFYHGISEYSTEDGGSLDCGDRSASNIQPTSTLSATHSIKPDEVKADPEQIDNKTGVDGTDAHKDSKPNENNLIFECTICNTVYQTARYLNKHNANVHSNLSLHCELCPKTFKNRDNLTKHKNKVHANWREKLNDPKYNWTGENRWECGTCNETFRTRKLRAVHYEEKEHSTRDAKKNLRDFICEYCNKLFKTRRQIRMHFATHFKQKCLCNECGLIFSWAQNLKIHQQRVHLKIAPTKKFKCSFCFKLFAHKHQMWEHENRHKNIRNVNCEHCSATFVTKAGLRAHMAQVHIGIRSHVCPICSKGFQIKGNLTAHMFVHSGTKPHHCPNCNQGFVRKYKMINHLQSCKEIPQNEEDDNDSGAK